MKHLLFWVVMAGLFLRGVHAADKPLKIRLEPFIQDVEEPVDLTHDGTKQLFVVEQAGKIRLVQDGKLQPKPWLDIRDRVQAGGECGLLGIAFHPAFAKNGRFFVNYTTRQNGLHTIISEFHAEPNASEASVETERVILKFKQPFANHNGGQILFGPDGMLYIGTGDGGAAGDPFNNGQRLDTLLGKILRINVDDQQPYAIPRDNPFVEHATARPEIWAYGLRNPWRFCFDRVAGLLYAADVGQNQWEEIDVIEKGKNYGWNLMEGTHPFKDGRPRADLVNPIMEYDHRMGISVTGGYVYRGKRFPELAGFYIYGDFASGRIWGLKFEEARVKAVVELFQGAVSPSSFGEDSEGELYLCDYHHDRVLRLAPAEAP